mgnify:FL=1
MTLLKMKKENLITVAGVVWLLAGANVALIGARAAVEMSGAAVGVVVALVVGTVAGFFAFHAMFGKIVLKNAQRIRGFEAERMNFLRFLDLKGYLIMAFMMSFGFSLRLSGLVPNWFFAFFYSGLGSALALAGASFLLHRAFGEGWTFHPRRVGE